MARTNRQWVLRRRPEGSIRDGDLELVENPVGAVPDGHVLVRTVYLSLDPTNRIWMSDMDQYMPPVEIGQVMRGGSLGVVEESRDPNVPVGSIVSPFTGWQDYSLVPGAMVRPLPRVPGLSPAKEKSGEDGACKTRQVRNQRAHLSPLCGWRRENQSV